MPIQHPNEYNISLFCTYILFQETFESAFRNIEDTLLNVNEKEEKEQERQEIKTNQSNAESDIENKLIYIVYKVTMRYIISKMKIFPCSPRLW